TRSSKLTSLKRISYGYKLSSVARPLPTDAAHALVRAVYALMRTQNYPRKNQRYPQNDSHTAQVHIPQTTHTPLIRHNTPALTLSTCPVKKTITPRLICSNSLARHGFRMIPAAAECPASSRSKCPSSCAMT